MARNPDGEWAQLSDYEHSNRLTRSNVRMVRCAPPFPRRVRACVDPPAIKRPRVRLCCTYSGVTKYKNHGRGLIHHSDRTPWSVWTAFLGSAFGNPPDSPYTYLNERLGGNLDTRSRLKVSFCSLLEWKSANNTMQGTRLDHSLNVV